MYLKHKPTGDIYPWHELLAKREDMEEYEPAPRELGAHPKAVPTYIKDRKASSVSRALDSEQINDTRRLG